MLETQISQLKIKNLDEEELSKYGQNKPNIVLEKGSSKEVKKIIAFCRQKLKGKKLFKKQWSEWGES